MKEILRPIQFVVMIVGFIVMIVSLVFGCGLLYLGIVNDFRSDGPGGLIMWFGPPFGFFFAYLGWIFFRGALVELRK